MKPLLFLLAGLCLAGCAVTGSRERSGAVTANPAGSAVAADHRVLPFIADDYSRALAEARARKVPIFIEAWAPW